MESLVLNPRSLPESRSSTSIYRVPLLLQLIHVWRSWLSSWADFLFVHYWIFRSKIRASISRTMATSFICTLDPLSPSCDSLRPRWSCIHNPGVLLKSAEVEKPFQDLPGFSCAARRLRVVLTRNSFRCWLTLKFGTWHSGSQPTKAGLSFHQDIWN